MAHRLELAAKGLAFERVATGGFVAIAPYRAIGALTTSGYDTGAARYVARLLGVRQVVLGVMLFAAVFLLINLMIYGLKVIRGALLESHAFSHMLDAPIFLLLAVGALALYLRQKECFGRLGKVGSYLTFGGFALAATVGYLYLYTRGTGVQGVLGELLHHGGGAVDDLSGGDLLSYKGIE